MAYTAPTSRSPGDKITASIWNTDLVDNIIDHESRINGMSLSGSSKVTLASAATSITVTGIPQTHYGLRIIARLRTDYVTNYFDQWLLTMTPSGSYHDHRKTGYHPGSGITNAGAGAASYFYDLCISDLCTAGMFSHLEFTILDYASTTREKVGWYTTGCTDPTSPGVFTGSVNYNSAANAITGFTLEPSSGTNFIAGSEVSVYLLAEAA